MLQTSNTKTSFSNDIHLQPGAVSSGVLFSTTDELNGDNNTGKPNFDWAQAAQQISRQDAKWDGGELGTAGSVTYSFLNNSQADGGYQELSAQQKAAVENAAAQWSSVANIDLKAADGGAGGNVSDQGKIQFQGYDGGGGGWASWSGRPDGATTQLTGATVALGGAGLSLALHEIGHALGMSHPGDYNGGGFTYERDAEFYQDSEQYTVMSYWGGEKTGAVLGRFATDENGQGVYMGGATGLGLYDIAAAQRVYGANQTTYADDTTYGFNSNTDDDGWTLEGKTDWIQAAIWDAGGNDTIDMSGYSENADIDLREESFSSTGGLKYNLAIAKGAVVENAIGGTGDDTMRGNDVANELTGGDGNDILNGAGGDDTLSGGDGDDTAVFSGNFVDYLISSVTDGVYAITDKLIRDGKDTISAVETFLFGDGAKTEAEIKAAATDAPIDPVDPDPIDPDPVDPDPVDPDPVDPDPVDPDPVDPDPVDPDPVDPDPVDPDPDDPTGTDDTLVYEPGKFNTLDGGEGNDTADFSLSASAVFVDLLWEGSEAWTTGENNLCSGQWEEIADLNSIENITGSAFDDHLAGTSQDNILIGASGSDLFRFEGNFGQDTIGDFEDGTDWILLSGFSDTSSFEQLDISQNGEDAVIALGSDSITLSGVDSEILTADDFAFC